MRISNSNIGYRPTWAEVNLGNLAYNFRQIKKILPSQIKVMPTIKADAYGHGIIPVAKKLESLSADYFGVASIDEGIILRRAGIKIPVLVMGLVLKQDIRPLSQYNLTQTVCSEELARALNNLGRYTKKAIKIHVKVDTGMGRIGVLADDAFGFIQKLRRLKYIRIEGLFTHLACADSDDKFTAGQIAIFNRIVSRLRLHGINIPLLHAANSLGAINFPESHFNMVRPGLVMYGLNPKGLSHKEGLGIELKPVLSLKTKVVYRKRVPGKFGVSYGHSYVTRRSTTVITLPIGYGDGYPRNLSNRAPVLIGGRRFKISGRVCMDQIMVDIGNSPAGIGDEVVLIGSQGQGRISAEELASLSGTIPYEIVCGIGSRVPRVYSSG